MAKSFEDIFESFGSVMHLLRDPKFQDLLVNYERAKKVFLVGYEVKDNVSSTVLFDSEGRSGLKPQDYLISFSEFVRGKQQEIEAIAILLGKPQQWSTKALTELRQKLKEYNYEEENLRKAHKIVYHKDTVDIISMVKHAVKDTEPLLSVDERVEMAIMKVIEGKNLTEDQHKWMGYIKEHLRQNMTLDENDLRDVPVFADRGGLRKFMKVFPGNYKAIIIEVNTALAA